MHVISVQVFQTLLAYCKIKKYDAVPNYFISLSPGGNESLEENNANKTTDSKAYSNLEQTAAYNRTKNESLR